MIYQLLPPTYPIRATIPLPSSKSISNRALILDALAYGEGNINNLATCDDTRVMVDAFSSDNSHFDIGAAGTAMRFMTAYLSKVVGRWTITGSERMKQRPIGLLVDALNSLGARVEYAEKEGYPPLIIYGSALQGGEIILDGGISSQFVSALLMLAPSMEKGLKITLTGNVVSTPYIRMTLGMMRQWGVESRWEDNVIEVAPQSYQERSYRVESDWSAASYWYAIVALSDNAEIELEGLLKESLQGDSAGRFLFEKLGVSSSFTSNGVLLKRDLPLCLRLEYDFTNEPDLVQTFAVVCCMLNIPFHFTGLQTLRIKETDRIAALENELRKLGYLLNSSVANTLSWEGSTTDSEPFPVIHTYEDHRMAMAFAPASLKNPTIRIAEPHVVSKSYPQFWDHLTLAGFTVEPIG